MTETIARKLDVFHLHCLRCILKITYRDHITNMEVYRRAYTQPLSVTVTERRFRFAGHILCLPDHRILKMAISWQPAQGTRKQGHPKIKKSSLPHFSNCHPNGYHSLQHVTLTECTVILTT